MRSTIRPSEAERFNAEWEALKGQGAKNAHPTKPPSAATLQFFDGLAQIDALLDSGPLGELASRVVLQGPEAASNRLEDLAPLFDSLQSLLSQAAIQSAIKEGRSLAQRPSAWLDLDPADGFASVPLARSLRWVRPLCAHALHCAFSSSEADTCLRNLAQALDLIQLLDDGSLQSLRRSSILASEVLVVLQALLPRTSVSADFLRAQIEPRLAMLAAPGRLLRVLQDESAYRVAIGRGAILEPQLAFNSFGLRYLDCTKEQSLERCLEFLRIYNSYRGQGNACNLVAQESARGVLPSDLRAIAEFHNFEIACHLARVALALNEHQLSKGSWPKLLSELGGYSESAPNSPCLSRRVDYKLDFNGIQLISFDRASQSLQTSIALHNWSWSQTNNSDLDARR